MPRDTDTLEFSPEKLESRQMLAGDVSVVARHGDLVINGDNESNRIHVTQDIYRRTTVTGIDGTYVNGTYNGSATVRVTDDVRINLKNGDNSALFGSSSRPRFKVPDDLTIRTGSGNDVTVFWGLQAGDDVSITAGTGSNQIYGYNFGDTSAYEVADDLRIKSHGSSNIQLHWSVGDDANITTGHQSDTIHLTSLSVQDKLAVRSGGSNDLIVMYDTHVYGKTNVNSGSGDDVFYWYGASGAHDDVVLAMGHGYDETYFRAAVYYGSTVRKTGVELET